MSKKLLKGRPNVQSAQVNHQQRQFEAQQISQCWTEHRITLIAYEMQYVHETKPQPNEKQKKNSKKNNLQFESGFLLAHLPNEQTQPVQNKISLFENLVYLKESTNIDEQYLYKFFKIMLELKHESIVHQFCIVYDQIAKLIKKIQFQAIKDEENRQKWLQEATKRLLHFIKNQKQIPPIMPYLTKHLEEFQISTAKLMKVQIYCFLAQKFNFNINEYYSEAFNVPTLQKVSKKIKTQES